MEVCGTNAAFFEKINKKPNTNKKCDVFLGREHTNDSDFEMTTQFIILQLGKDSVFSVGVQVTL